MHGWLAVSHRIDQLNEWIGRGLLWLVLLASLVSAGNALVRKTLGVSSNGWLEIQWYLFAAMVLLAAGYTLKHNGHVRIDVFSGRLSPRTRAWIDLFGAIFFLLPLCGLLVALSWPDFTTSLRSGELSPDAGGLVRWPVRALIPLGFMLLAAQGLSEMIKRIAFLRGLAPLDVERPVEKR